jgi:hypothetical protein
MYFRSDEPITYFKFDNRSSHWYDVIVDDHEFQLVALKTFLGRTLRSRHHDQIAASSSSHMTTVMLVFMVGLLLLLLLLLLLVLLGVFVIRCRRSRKRYDLSNSHDDDVTPMQIDYIDVSDTFDKQVQLHGMKSMNDNDCSALALHRSSLHWSITTLTNESSNFSHVSISS